MMALYLYTSKIELEAKIYEDMNIYGNEEKGGLSSFFSFALIVYL